jgi:predicted dehydrogenase
MKASELLRFGICGLGFMGRTHFRYLRENPRAQVVAVCDKNPDVRSGCWRATGNLDACATEHVDLHGVAQYAQPDELIADPRVDVVAVTLPTPMHAEITVRALEAGKHVLCEKPMAATLEECDRMIAAARSSGRTLMVAQCIRFWPQYEMIKALVEAGRIGAVRFAKLARLSCPPTYSVGNWLLIGAASGGALLDLHVHDVDFALDLLGVPATIHAVGCRGLSGRIDHSFATYRYPDGRYALLEVSWVYHAPWPFEMAITVCGESGTLAWSSRAGTDVLLYAGGREAERIACGGENGWKRELEYYVDCVQAGRPVARCLPESSRTSISLFLAEQRSIGRGEPIAVIGTPATPAPNQNRD